MISRFNVIMYSFIIIYQNLSNDIHVCIINEIEITYKSC